MKKLIMIIIFLHNFLLFAQSNVLVDLIHGVNYYTASSWLGGPIDFEAAFQGYDIVFLESSMVIMETVLIDETQPGNQQIIYNFDLPDESEFDTVNSIYATCNRGQNFASGNGFLINPQGEIVTEMFNGFIHYVVVTK